MYVCIYEYVLICIHILVTVIELAFMHTHVIIFLCVCEYVNISGCGNIDTCVYFRICMNIHL